MTRLSSTKQKLKIYVLNNNVWASNGKTMAGIGICNYVAYVAGPIFESSKKHNKMQRILTF
jgi:hypothetical protein